MTIYIAGKMRGIPYYNFPAFDAARDRLRECGFSVVSPADLDRDVGFDPATLPPDFDWFSVPPGFDIAAAVAKCAGKYIMGGGMP